MTTSHLLFPLATQLPRFGEQSFHRHSVTPFVRGRHERVLELTVDNARLGSDPDTDLLTWFARHELIDMVVTAPVHAAAALAVGALHQEEDALEAHLIGSDCETLRPIRAASTWFAFAREHSTMRKADPTETLRRYLLLAASAGRTDGLVLGDFDYVHNLAENHNPLSVRQALALIGLFIRFRQNSIDLPAPGGRYRVSVHSQYHCVGRALIPSSHTWFGRCYISGQETTDDSAVQIAEAVHVRFPRCIRARDKVIVQCLLAEPDADHDELLYHLDALLMGLSGCFDAVARVAHLAYDLPEKKHRIAGWRRPEWLDLLNEAGGAPLCQLVAPGSRIESLVALISSLRDTIHTTPLAQVQYSASQGSRTTQRLVGVPTEVAPRLRSATEGLGGSKLWGLLLPTMPQGIDDILDPLPFVQLLMPFAATALDLLMAATETSRLPGVASAQQAVDPPVHLYSDERVKQLRLLAGLLL